MGHNHDDRYPTTGQVTWDLNNMLATKVFSEQLSFNNQVTRNYTFNAAVNGWTPVAVSGWEVGENNHVLIQRCEINGTNLVVNLRSGSNDAITTTVYCDITVLYRLNF